MTSIRHASAMRSLVVLLAPLALASCGPHWSEAVDEPPTIADCPSFLPVSGSSCSQYRTCYYEPVGCSTSFTQATCSGGRWRILGDGGACVDSGTDSKTDAKTDGGTTSCPAGEPAIGSACSGTSACTYDNLCPLISLKSNTYRCIGGKWSFDNTLESPIDCPKAQPNDGQACGCAMYLPSKCAYSSKCGSVDAVCDGATQRWKVAACSSTDAGAADSATDAASASDASASDSSLSDSGTESGADSSVSSDASSGDASAD